MKPSWGFAFRGESTDTLELDVYDVIGEGCFSEGVSARDVRAKLRASNDAKSIRVRVNSGGGEIVDGLAIYNLLKSHSAKVEVDVDGLAASMASIIAMAGDEIRMAPASFMMIHNPWGIAMGDPDDMRQHADVLDKMKGILVGVYVARTGKSENEVRQMMDDETWMTGAEAVELGFADKCGPGKKPSKGALQAFASAHRFGFENLPKELTAMASHGDHVVRVEMSDEMKASIASIEALAKSMAATTPPPDGPADPQQPPIREKTPMADEKDNGITMTVARALALPVGCTEHDVLTKIAQLRELESGTLAATGVASSGEIVGAVRALKESAGRLAATEEKLAKVEAERDVQNFEALVQQAQNERKMTPAQAEVAREQFNKAITDGRGAAHIEDLRGWVKASSPILGAPRKAPEIRSGSLEALTWNGKKYSELKPAQQARLANEDPELFRQMKANAQEIA